MVSKWGKDKGDWKLSPKQRLEKEKALRQANEVRRIQQEEQQAIRLAREALDAINTLVRQYGGPDKVFVGCYYRNGMGSHFQLLFIQGQLTARFLSEDEKRGEFGWVWLPAWPKDQIGDGDLGHQDKTFYEEVFPFKAGVNNHVWLQNPFSGQFFVIQQQRKVMFTRVPNGFRWDALPENFYDASRPCCVWWDDQWIFAPAWHFYGATPAFHLIPNPVVEPISGFQDDGSAPQTIPNNGVEAAPMVPVQPEDDYDPFRPLINEEIDRRAQELGFDIGWQDSDLGFEPTVSADTPEEVTRWEDMDMDIADMDMDIVDIIGA